MPKYESLFAIGQKVSIDIPGQQSIYGYVRVITFTRTKVRYAVQVYGSIDDITTLHNIDSAYVNAVEPHEFMDMPEDNYS